MSCKVSPNNERLQALPSISKVVGTDAFTKLAGEYGTGVAKFQLRDLVASRRAAILANERAEAPSVETLMTELQAQLVDRARQQLLLGLALSRPVGERVAEIAGDAHVEDHARDHDEHDDDDREQGDKAKRRAAEDVRARAVLRRHEARIP